MRATASESRHVFSRDGLTRLPFESEPLAVSGSQPEALISPSLRRAHSVPFRADNHGQQRCNQSLTPAA